MCTLGTGAPNTPPDHQTIRERERARLDERQEDDVEGRLEGGQGCEGHSQRWGRGGWCSADMDGFSASAKAVMPRAVGHKMAF